MAGTRLALADWQYSKWGMTPEQVQTAAGGRLKSVTNQRSCPTCTTISLLAGEYSADGFQFKVGFEFEDGTSLSIVSLEVPATSGTWGCNRLFDGLSAKYGAPIWKSPTGLTGLLPNVRWLDPVGGNTIFFSDLSGIMGTCSVQYSPLASAKGL